MLQTYDNILFYIFNVLAGLHLCQLSKLTLAVFIIELLQENN